MSVQLGNRAQLQMCWCGNAEIKTFSPDYYQCAKCHTLVSTDFSKINKDKLTTEESYYNKDYWLSLQNIVSENLDIYKRSRSDLIERCIYWLKIFLQYQLPPAKTLELGCSHGGFVALLKLLGMDAQGQELSPWVVNYAHETFSIDMLQGNIEDQKIAPQSFDSIILMDVLEHLLTPVSTLQHCVNLLKDDGFFFIQTPCLPEPVSYQDLIAEQHPFLSMMRNEEHLYLFSKKSVTTFFARLGFNHIYFEPAIFSKYDMCFMVSRKPLVKKSFAEIQKFLESFAKGRLGLALIDFYDQVQFLSSELQENAKKLIKIDSENKTQMQLIKNQKALIDQLVISKKGPINIAIDLTPILSGGTNGGAKVFILKLIPKMAEMAPTFNFILLTREENHDELAYLDSDNIKRHCVFKSKKEVAAFSDKVTESSYKNKVASHYKNKIVKIINFAKIKIKRVIKKLFFSYKDEPLLKQLKVDLLFCPFTNVRFAIPQIPTVSIIYDLQYRIYPHFFSVHEYHERESTLKESLIKSNYLICISDYTKKTVNKFFQGNENKLERVYISIANRFSGMDDNFLEQFFVKFQLKKESYLIYPANFWKHKNHEMLFLGFLKYLTKQESNHLKLVCTGAESERMHFLQKILTRLNLENDVILVSYLPDDALCALIKNSFAVIFPSLYEGFGIPVSEAMALEVPVLCSKTTSLPEVGGDAVLYFDPRNPEDIADAILKLESNPDLRQQLIYLGKQKAHEFAVIDKMANEYLAVFSKALNNTPEFASVLYGVYVDGWCTDNIQLVYDKISRGDYLELSFFLPSWSFDRKLSIDISVNNSKFKYKIKRGQTITIKQILNNTNGLVDIRFFPTFIPAQLNPENHDGRKLSCIIKSCKLISETNPINFYSVQEIAVNV